MRQTAALSIVLLLAGPRGWLAGQLCDPPFIACTPENAMGRTGVREDSVSDLAYRPELRELWAVEGPLPRFNGLSRSRITICPDGLAGGCRLIVDPKFSEPVFGIAGVPAGHAFAGNCFLLTPDATPAAAGLDPRIGIMNDLAEIVPGGEFTPVVDPATGGPPPGYFSAIDVHPSGLEIALLDRGAPGAGGRQSILFVDLQYRAVRGPFSVEGLSTFYGGGIAYNTEATVLVVSQFGSSFEAGLALEYDRLTGVYTGRTLLLDRFGLSERPLALAIDTGFVAGEPALFFYNVATDSVYALPDDPFGLEEGPGPVQGLDPSCAVLPDGRARLTWTNHPAYRYDRIAIIENGVETASLPAGATEYTTATPIAGKAELCLETRSGGLPNVLRACCEGQSGAPLPFQDPGALPACQVDVDDLATNPHFQLGIACLPIVDRKEDFRLYVIGTFDNKVRVVNHKCELVPEEAIATSPERLSRIQGSIIADSAASGIAILDVRIQGETVPMYALLDADGGDADGNGVADFIPRASIHFLKDTVLPGAGAPVKAGARFQDEISTIETSAGQGGRFFVDWDADAAGDLITLDSEQRSVLRIRYDPAANSLRAISEATLPLRGLTPFSARSFPLGGIAVLPSGNYLVAGGDAFDATISRAFLLTPFIGEDPERPDPARSVKLIGFEEGLYTFSQFYAPEAFGRAVGPDSSRGLETVFFRNEGPGSNGVAGLYYNIPHHFPTRLRGFQGNFLVGLASIAGHPGLKAEPLLDEETLVGAQGLYETEDLRPSFGPQVDAIDFDCQLLNPSETTALRIDLGVVFDGIEMPELAERDVVVPAGRSLRRRFPQRPEKSLRVRLVGRAAGNQLFRLLVGATGVASASGTRFRRGDSNGDGAVDLSDPIFILTYQFLAGEAPRCPDAADRDDTDVIDLTDPIYLLTFMFLAGPAPPPPGPTDCGPDPGLLSPCAYDRC